MDIYNVILVNSMKDYIVHNGVSAIASSGSMSGLVKRIGNSKGVNPEFGRLISFRRENTIDSLTYSCTELDLEDQKKFMDLYDIMEKNIK